MPYCHSTKHDRPIVNTRDARTTGWVAEAMATAALIDEGYEVSRPLMDGLPYDLVAVSEGEFYRIQVKAISRRPNNHISLPLSRPGAKGGKLRTYTHGVEIFIGVDTSTGSMWKIPFSDVSNRLSISVHNIPAWRNPLPPPQPVLRPSPSVRADLEAMNLRNDPSAPTYVKRQVNPRTCHTTRSKLRGLMEGKMPAERPPNISEQDWWILTKFMQGYGAKSLAAHVSLDPSSVKNKLKRLVDRITKPPRVPSFTTPISHEEEASLFCHPPA